MATTLRPDQIGVVDRWESRWRRAWRFLVQRGPAEVWRLARAHGLRGSSEFLWRNLRLILAIRLNRRFDQRYNVETAGNIPNTYLNVVGPNREHGHFFLSSPITTCRAMLRSLPAGEDYRDFAFVDLGSGKGRALLIAAAEYDFRRVIGVEYATALHEAAVRNIETYSGPRRCGAIEAMCADATMFHFPEDPLVVYLLSPFDDTIFAQVLANLRASYDAKPRKIYVLYGGPRVPETLQTLTLFARAEFLYPLASPALPFDWSSNRAFWCWVFQTRPNADGVKQTSPNVDSTRS
jgi:SAM-dependent methyltransferase